mmetsp:Transcript_22120/g.65601  ORF Transcript_22120/g.65601 Transcript_22120/m.65601 type:complete len:222 (-) Transcript_22120:1296-1961(-)
MTMAMAMAARPIIRKDPWIIGAALLLSLRLCTLDPALLYVENNYSPAPPYPSSASASASSASASFPVVDAVFTYVNGSDPHFIEELSKYGGNHSSPRTDPSRYRGKSAVSSHVQVQVKSCCCCFIIIGRPSVRPVSAFWILFGFHKGILCLPSLAIYPTIYLCRVLLPSDIFAERLVSLFAYLHLHPHGTARCTAQTSVSSATASDRSAATLRGYAASTSS